MKDDVNFDEETGISAEEQKEIYSQIDKIAEKNRLSLSKGAVGSVQSSAINAKKNGALFPLIVNGAAIVILLAGAFLLVFVNSKKDEQVRTGSAVYDITEKALIEEIRKDTAEKIAAKETEIDSISSRLEDVDAQLAQLYSSNEELNAEQRVLRERLIAMQNAYRQELTSLNEERSRILEESRTREARLRAQLEERAREFAAAQQKTTGELTSAMGELERLSTEQEKLTAMDAQMSGGLSAINALVQNSRYDEAMEAVESLRILNNQGAYSTSRSYASKREFYNQAINSIGLMIEEVRKNIGVDKRDLLAKNTQLENSIAEMQKTLAAFSSDSSGQARRLVELDESISALRTTTAALETSVAERNRTISSLETERGNLNQTVSDLKSVNAEQEQEISNLRSQLTIIRQALQE